MRILLSTIGSRGDVQPLVALAAHLKALGHDPRLCVPPDFREWIEGLGLPVTPIGPEVRRFAAARSETPVMPSLEQRRQLAEATVSTQFETLTAAATGCDVIVAATALQIAARSIAERMGIPYVFAAYTPSVLPSPHHAPPSLPPLPGDPTAATDNATLWTRDADRFHALFGAALNTHREALGLPPVSDTRGHMFTDHPWLAADPVLAPWPGTPSDGVTQTGAWLLPDHRSLPRELEAFLDQGEPPIYFGFGSTRAQHGVGEEMIQAARAVGRRAVISRGWFDDPLVESTPDCFSIGEVNLQLLFTRVAAAVHHGGAGTTTAAALAGTTQVVLSQRYDQHYWAERVAQLGIGARHPTAPPAAETLAGALDLILRPSVAAQARSLAASIRRDGTQIAAGRLLAL